MMHIVRRCTVAALIVNASTAAAGGLWLNEFGDLSGGRAAAGAAAGVDNAMTIAYNPASITRLPRNQVFASLGAFLPNMNFDVNYSTPRLGYGDGGNAAENMAYSSAAFTYDMGASKWSTGIALVPLAGAGAKYSDDWAGRYQATKVELMVMALAPTVAYQVTDQLSLGASVQGVYSDLNIHVAGPRIDPNKPDGRIELNGDDTQAAFTLGAMYELGANTRFGLAYQSKIQPKFNGDLKLSGPDIIVSSDTELTLAEYVRFSVHQAMDERWSVEATVGWDNWSQLGDIVISTDERAVGEEAGWHDTYHFAWGTEYKLDKYWTLTAGVAYDTNPVSSQDRTAQLPVDKQWRYATGAEYALSPTLSVGGYVNYADLGSAQITSRRYGGSFDYNNLTQVIANLKWTF